MNLTGPPRPSAALRPLLMIRAAIFLIAILFVTTVVARAATHRACAAAPRGSSHFVRTNAILPPSSLSSGRRRRRRRDAVVAGIGFCHSNHDHGGRTSTTMRRCHGRSRSSSGGAGRDRHRHRRRGTLFFARDDEARCSARGPRTPSYFSSSDGNANDDFRYQPYANSSLFSSRDDNNDDGRPAEDTESHCNESTIETGDSKSNRRRREYDWTSKTTAIALPALAGMMTDPLLSMVDTLFVGRLGGGGSTSSGGSSSSIPLAALGACTSIFHLSFHCFRATTMSTSSLVAGALARDEREEGEGSSWDGDRSEAALVARTSIQQALVTGILITSFLLAFGPKCLLAMGIPSPTSAGGVGQSSQLYPSALTYLNHRALAAPAVVVLSAAEGIFRGHGDVVTPWKVSCIVALLNLVLDPFCMFGEGGRMGGGLGMGIKGAAIATAFSQVCGAILYGRYLSRKGMMGKDGGGGVIKKNASVESKQRKAELKHRKRAVSGAILRANAAMMAKQGSLLLGWAYAAARATRMGTAAVASHQMALSIWMVTSLVLEGAGVAAQVLMAKEWEGLQVAEKKKVDGSARRLVDDGRSAIRSLSSYMMRLSLVQGLLGSLSVLLFQKWSPSFLLTRDPIVRANLLVLLPYVAAQMTLVSVTLVTEALAIGGGRFRWLAGGTTLSSALAVAKLRGATDLVGIWNGGIVALFLGRLATASLAVMDMNGMFRWRRKLQSD